MDDDHLLPPAQSPSPFLSLAPELKQIIFSALPDASTLRSLVLTCSSCYVAFLGAEALIVNSVLHSQLGSDLMFDAILVFTSTTLESHCDDAATELLKLYAKQNRTCLYPIQKLRDALAVGSLHDNVEFFSSGFAASALSINPVTGLDEASPSPLSLLESNRIKRTFYRYELFCNIFRRRERVQDVQATRESPQSIFFSTCAPWENEQLACVRNYLFECLSLPFNGVAKHDVEWGKLRMNYITDWLGQYRYWKEHYLSLGLAYLCQVVKTSAYNDRCDLLKARKEDADCALYDALMAQGYGNGLSHLGTYTEEDELIHIPAQRAIDRDNGPEKAWRWAYADNTNAYWYNINAQGSLRQRGYVMWDSARLIQWGLLSHEWDELPRESVSDEEERRLRDEMEDSWEARKEIWRRGGRGWWSAGDESRIIWLPPPPPPRRPATMKPKMCWGNRKVWATDMQTWRENL